MGKFQPLPLVNFRIFLCLTFEELKKAQPHTGTSVYLSQKLLDRSPVYNVLSRLLYLRNKNTGHSVKYKFQKNSKYLLVYLRHTFAKITGLLEIQI